MKNTMKKRTVLIVSTIFAVMTIGSIATYANAEHHRQGGNPEQRAEMIIKKMTEKLSLTEVQVENLRAVQAEAKARRETRKAEKKANKENTRQKFLALLDSPTLDQNQAQALIAERARKMQERAHKMQAHAASMIPTIAGFTNSLSAEQRAQFKDMLANGKARGFGLLFGHKHGRKHQRGQRGE